MTFQHQKRFEHCGFLHAIKILEKTLNSSKNKSSTCRGFYNTVPSQNTPFLIKTKTQVQRSHLISKF